MCERYEILMELMKLFSVGRCYNIENILHSYLKKNIMISISHLSGNVWFTRIRRLVHRVYSHVLVQEGVGAMHALAVAFTTPT